MLCTMRYRYLKYMKEKFNSAYLRLKMNKIPDNLY